MSSTFLTVVVLAVMWAIVLLPVLIGRRGQVRESGSVERVATAIRVLARRSSFAAEPVDVADESSDFRSDVAVAAQSAQHNAVVASDVAADSDVEETNISSDSRMRAHARLIVRRRRTFVALLVSTVATLFLACAAQDWAPVLWTIHATCDLLLVGYVGGLRKEVKRQRVRRLRRESAARSGSVARSFGSLDRRNETVHSGPSRSTRSQARADNRAAERQRVRHQHTPGRVELDDEDPSFAEFDFDRHGRAANY